MEIKAKINSYISRLCVALLALLGYNCSSDPEKNILEMYGTPTGSFEIKGEVTDEQGSPVTDAEIRVTDPRFSSSRWSFAKGVTNLDGFYTVSGKGSETDKIKIVCIPQNNALEPDSIILPIEYIPNKESQKDSWYVGHADMTFNFVLKPNK